MDDVAYTHQHQSSGGCQGRGRGRARRGEEGEGGAAAPGHGAGGASSLLLERVRCVIGLLYEAGASRPSDLYLQCISWSYSSSTRGGCRRRRGWASRSRSRRCGPTTSTRRSPSRELFYHAVTLCKPMCVPLLYFNPHAHTGSSITATSRCTNQHKVGPGGVEPERVGNGAGAPGVGGVGEGERRQAADGGAAGRAAQDGGGRVRGGWVRPGA